MGEDAVANFRIALRQAVDEGDADGLPPELSIVLMVSELGRLVAHVAAADDLERLLANVQSAMECAARLSLADLGAPGAEQPVERWLN